MNGEGEFVINKKKNIIDDAPVSKKVARNQQKKLNKTLANVSLIQQLNSKKVNGKKQSETSNTSTGNSKSESKLDAKTRKKVQDIKAILSQLSQKTILQALQKNSFDQQQTLEYLFNLQPDELQTEILQPPPTSSKNFQKTKVQLGNDLLNEIYQNNDEIDPSEFQQLFAEIADIIKEEQKNQGMDLFEINQFIDDCYLIKNVILEDQTEIYIDENDELCRQTEIFMEEIIKNRVALELKRQEEFPTLGAVNKNNGNQKGTIQKIQEQYQQQRRNQQYFTPSRVPQIYNHDTKNGSNKYSVYSVNNNPRSYEDIRQLSKQYNDMGIDKLKYIYIRLEDINLCKRFLDRYYPNHKRIIKVQKVEQNKKQGSYTSSTKPALKPSYKKLEDVNFKNYSLNQIRDQLDHLFKLRSLFRITKGKTTNIAHRKQLERLAHRDDSRIEKLCEVARYKAVEYMLENNPQYIDLHGYREQEIDELFDQIADMIKVQFKKGNSKLQTNKVGNNVCCVVRALTGKGLHSKYNRSVLKPCLQSWCDRRGYKTTETEDSINLFIEVR